MIRFGANVNIVKPLVAALLAASVSLVNAQQNVAIIDSPVAEQAPEATSEPLTPEQLAEQQLQEQRQLLRSDIVQLSGLAGLSQQARNLAQQTLNEQQAQLGYQYQVASRVAQFWNPQLIEGQLQQALESASDEDLAALQQLLNDARLQDARAKESSAVSDQGSTEFQAYVQKLRAQPPGAARLALVQELDKAMRFSEFMLLTRASVYAQLEAVLKGWKPAEDWQQTLQNEVQEFLLYTYRRTPNDGIRELTSLYQNQALQQWLAAVKQSLPQQPAAQQDS